MSRLRHMDLFSGIGGFALAVRWLGHETVGFCEIDEWCRKVLDKHWPEVPKHDDIRTLKGTEFGPIDLITGGFPCQPFSVAGQRRGEDDPRHLWPAMHRIIDTARPRFVLAENVAGIVNMALDGVLADLEAIGYTAGAVVIPAGAVNALHRRDRVWIMAYSEVNRVRGAADNQAGAAGSSFSASGEKATTERMADTDGDERGASRDTHDQAGPVSSVIGRGVQQNVGHADEPGLEGRQFGGERAGERAARQTGGESTGRRGTEVARALDFSPDGLSPELVRSRWADGTWEVDLPRVVTHEAERKQKLQAAGNAIVPQVAYEILREMIGEAG